jgi:uracil-DNA glycosylase family protein
MSTAEDLIPARPSIPKLREAAESCRACELWQKGTQVVFGEGTRAAEVMLVGEQPGDREDRQGHPFVGPAGRLLDRGLVAAGFDRKKIYVTNIVKHFNWTPRGKRRIHKKPNMSHITACRPWLDAELRTVRPRAVVCLGSTAAQALLGSDFRVSSMRGEPVESDLAEIVSATVHPSSILRGPEDQRHKGFDDFVKDLKQVAARLRA